MRDLNLKRWHIAKAKGYIFDASIHRASSRLWQSYMSLAAIERRLEADGKLAQMVDYHMAVAERQLAA